MKIIFIGFMGSGKSTLAKALSERIHFTLLEMDQQACEKTQTRNIPELFSKGGELLLREMEIEIAKECRAKEQLIISTGGGVVMNKIIIDYLKEHQGKVFFLHVSFETITQRLQGDSSRPLFQEVAQAKALYDFRLPLYQRYADYVIQR